MPPTAGVRQLKICYCMVIDDNNKRKENLTPLLSMFSMEYLIYIYTNTSNLYIVLSIWWFYQKPEIIDKT
jgi:hypothetical protein